MHAASYLWILLCETLPCNRNALLHAADYLSVPLALDLEHLLPEGRDDADVLWLKAVALHVKDLGDVLGTGKLCW